MDDSAYDCPLCLCSIEENLYVTKCNHKFHRKCICDYVTYNLNKNPNPIVCPYCKQNMEESQQDDSAQLCILINDKRFINSATACKKQFTRIIVDVRKKYWAYQSSFWAFCIMLFVLIVVMVASIVLAVYTRKRHL